MPPTIDLSPPILAAIALVTIGGIPLGLGVLAGPAYLSGGVVLGLAIVWLGAWMMRTTGTETYR